MILLRNFIHSLTELFNLSKAKHKNNQQIANFVLCIAMLIPFIAPDFQVLVFLFIAVHQMFNLSSIHVKLIFIAQELIMLDFYFGVILLQFEQVLILIVHNFLQFGDFFVEREYFRLVLTVFCQRTLQADVFLVLVAEFFSSLVVERLDLFVLFF
jgi:hypothetical protein